MKKRNYILGLFSLCAFITFSQIPTVDWAKHIGFNGIETGMDIISDGNGNVYTVGHFAGSIDADPGAGTVILTSVGMADILIVKFDANGNFVWAKNIGSTLNDAAYGVAISTNNHLYITGYFSGHTDFDPSGAVSTVLNAGGPDIFILKMDLNGDYMWAKSVGGSGEEIGYSIDTDGFENIHITGSYASVNTDFDPTAGFTNLSPIAGKDAFYASYSNLGDLISVKSFGGSLDDVATAIDFDYNGFVNITGYFSGTADFDPDAPLLNLTSNGGTDIFVSRFYGGSLFCAKSFGGVFDDKGNGITGDMDNNVTYTGFFQNAVDFNNNLGFDYILTSAGLADVIVSKLNSSGNYMWAKSIGNSTNDKAFAITVDAANYLYLTGNFQNMIDADPGAGFNYLSSTSGGFDVFLLKLDPNGAFVWSNFFQQTSGVLNNNQGNGIHIDENDNLYVTGYIQGGVDFDFDITLTGGTLFSSGQADLFVAKIAFSTSVVLICPADQNLLASASPPIVPDVTSLATSSTNCPSGGNIITQSPVSGSPISFGPNIVTLTATNNCGDVTTCQVLVNYTNDLSLTIQCPANQIVSTNNCPDFISLAIVTSNCVSGGVVTTQTPLAGSILSLGTNLITLTSSNNCGSVSTCSFIVDYILGLDEEYSSIISIYPNPTKEVLTILSEKEITLQLKNVQGQKLQSIKVQGESTIDVSNLSPGMYYLVGDDNNQLKFIKE